MTEQSPSSDEIGRRLDHVIAARCALSRRMAWRWLEAGAVTLNDRQVGLAQKGRRLQANDRLVVEAAETVMQPIAEPDPSVREAARGTDWIGVCKPAGMAVHPLQVDERGTVLNALIARYPAMLDVGEGGLRRGVVHRLDTPTSGAMVFALSEQTWRLLRDRFHHGLVTKRYHALVHGRVNRARREVMPLRVTKHRPARVSVVDPSQADRADVRNCALSYRPLAHFDDATLLSVDLETGFLHQIRVMLAARDHPVVGDDRYGRDAALDGAAGRLMLHARALYCDLCEVRCAWPVDFREIVRRLRR